MKKLVLGFLLLISLSLIPAFAQTAPVPDDYNFCNDANAWGDGRCNSPDIQVNTCHVMFGWYLPRMISGDIVAPDIFANDCIAVVASVSASQQDACAVLNVSLINGSQQVSSCSDTDVIDNTVNATVSNSDNNQPVQVAQISEVDRDYNWCSDPAVWGNGECVNQDTSIEACMWEMGWYLPRVGAGEFSLSDVKTPCLLVAANSGLVSVEKSEGCSYIVVVLAGSSYTGTADINEASNNYDGSALALGNNCGLKIYGNDNANTLVGSSGNDRIYGYGGNDTIYGDSINGDGSGNDTIYGGDGNDTILGDSLNGNGSGNDKIFGEDGGDLLFGDSSSGNGSGNDKIDGGAGGDDIYGDSQFADGSGNDRINGGDDFDVITGDTVNGTGSGNDRINGGGDTDIIYGDSVFGNGTGNDIINGGDGDDIITGDSGDGDGTGNDTINGNAGDDEIYGDTVNGNGSGDDDIDGGIDNTEDSVAGPGNSQDSVENVASDTSTPDN